MDGIVGSGQKGEKDEICGKMGKMEKRREMRGEVNWH
jgi:hypothetical protein